MIHRETYQATGVTGEARRLTRGVNIQRAARAGAALLPLLGLSCTHTAGTIPADNAEMTVSGSADIRPMLLPELTVDGTSGVTLSAINGTYGASCKYWNGSSDVSHAATDMWTVALAGYSGTVYNYNGSVTSYAAATNPLAIEMDNSACVLTLATLTLSNGDTYSASSTPTTMSLTGSYAGTPLHFNYNQSTTATASPTFYGNCDISPTSFASMPTITCILSDDAAAASASTTAGYQTYTASGSGSNVPAPNYTASMSGVTVSVDSTKLVQSASGNVVLTYVSQAGTSFGVYSGTFGHTPPTGDELVTAFSGVGSTTAISSHAAINIPVSSMITAGVTTLNATSYVILQNTDTASNVSSYELVTLTFNAP